GGVGGRGKRSGKQCGGGERCGCQRGEQDAQARNQVSLAVAARPAVGHGCSFPVNVLSWVELTAPITGRRRFYSGHESTCEQDLIEFRFGDDDQPADTAWTESSLLALRRRPR